MYRLRIDRAFILSSYIAVFVPSLMTALMVDRFGDGHLDSPMLDFVAALGSGFAGAAVASAFLNRRP